MRRLKPTLVAILLLALVAWWQYEPQPALVPPPPNAVQTQPSAGQLPDFLPAQAHHTLALIAEGGPYPYRQDDGVFGNREHLLPRKPRGYYHEYTVVTPGARTRGARRIITGGTPPEIYYYTSDHYRSFRSFEVPR